MAKGEGGLWRGNDIFFLFLRQERDQLEIRSMRKRLVHHAQPILKGRPVQVKRSQRALTVPHSPMIGKKRQRK